MPNQVCRFNPETDIIRIVADRPNGIALTKDERLRICELSNKQLFQTKIVQIYFLVQIRALQKGD
jgi:hypothetical protein